MPMKGKASLSTEVPVTQGDVGIGLVLHLLKAAHRQHGGGRMHVVEERRGPGEAFVSDELLGVETAVRTTEGDVPLSRDLAQGVVKRHLNGHRFPRSSCSRSMASNNALKFPAPKLFAPLR